ncbi:MAG: MarR family winged helix-turn-helix transcriptional regulator [Bacteroidota bacterium]
MTDKGQNTSISAAEETTGFLLWQAANGWQRLMRNALADLKLTHVQFVLLAGINHLAAKGKPVTQNAIAAHAGTDKMMTSKVLRTLENKSLIIRDKHEKDTRARSLSLTPEGELILAKAAKVVHHIDLTFFRLPLKNARVLNSVLTELNRRAHTGLSMPDMP